MKGRAYNESLLKLSTVDILACKIIIWTQKDVNTIEMTPPPDEECMIIRECVNIEIDESYKKLIGTAIVRLPKGSIARKTITRHEEMTSGATRVNVERLADGTITEKRDDYSVLRPDDFNTDQRIRIYLGYYRDEGRIFKSKAERQKAMDQAAMSGGPMFDGYIVKCSASTPIELKCENLASFLKRINCKPITTQKNAKVNDFLKPDGKYYMLKDTGLKVHPDTAECDINIGMVKLTDDLTIADVLTEWSKYKLYSFIRVEDDVPYIKVGRSYFSSKTKESLISDSESSEGTFIQFDYHVANDGLTMSNITPRQLAVSAEGFQYNGKQQTKLSLTIRLNPEWGGPNDKEHKKFQILNQTKLSKKSMKLGAVPRSGANKVNLSTYTVISYTSNNIGITEEQLVKEAEDYFEGYNLNGIEGTLTIFGDYKLKSGTKVELLDPRNPEKNGWYLVEEVTTTFGVNGFRQRLKLPYCIAKADKK